MEGLESCEWRMELEMGVALLLPTGCLHVSWLERGRGVVLLPPRGCFFARLSLLMSERGVVMLSTRIPFGLGLGLWVPPARP